MTTKKGRIYFKPFWSWVQVGLSSECWPWLRSKDKNGYGRSDRKHYGEKVASRAAWRLAHQGQEIPGALIVCHSCDNPTCCNPAHLFLGTHKVNAEDRDRKRRGNTWAANDAVLRTETKFAYQTNARRFAFEGVSA